MRDLTAHATCSLEGELWCYERMQTHQKDGARAFSRRDWQHSLQLSFTQEKIISVWERYNER